VTTETQRVAFAHRVNHCSEEFAIASFLRNVTVVVLPVVSVFLWPITFVLLLIFVPKYV